MKIPIR